MSPVFDILIAGAGPAGAALAIALRNLLPHLSVALVDPGWESPFRIGESVPPPIKPFLDQLGLGTIFNHGGHAPAFRTFSAWGAPELMSNEFFLYVHNTGWRLDRVHFDQTLHSEAARRGAAPLKAVITALSFEHNSWRVDCGKAGTVDASFIVDATGRSARLLRMLGVKRVKHDRLLACAVFFEQDRQDELVGADAAVVEACRAGWWYTVPLPDGRRVAMLMTDTDIARDLGVVDYGQWQTCVAKTCHIRRLLDGAIPLSSPLFWSAASHFFDTRSQSEMLAIGDALSTFDPLSSQGITKALRSAIFASYAIADRFLRNDFCGLARYHALTQSEFSSYLDTRRNYYRQEQRWSDTPFWQRRY